MPEDIQEIDETAEVPDLTEDENSPLVIFGDAVKALGDGKVGGYLVRYTTEVDPDLQLQFFNKDTDYGELKSTDVYYQHGMDRALRKRVIGKANMRFDNFGVWAEAQLQLRDKYEKFIYSMAKKGKLGWSSGTMPNLIETEARGKAEWVKKWPLGLDASLTPAPVEPRNAAVPLKSLLSEIETPTLDELVEAAGDVAPVDGEAEVSNEDEVQTKRSEQMELTQRTQEEYDELLAEAGRKGAEAALKSLPSINQDGVQVTHDEADTPFESFAVQLDAIKAATLTQGRELAPRLKALNVKAALGANELVGSEGGFLLEPTFAEGILTPMHEMGPFSNRANRLAIGANSNSLTVRAVDETSRATGSRWGGVQGYRLAEADTKTASQPSFRLVDLKLKKYAVVVYATEELLQDTTALAGIVQQGASEELNFMLNDDIVNGAGNAGPLGILASGALVSVAKESGQAAATIVTENIFKMWARLHPRSKSNAVWYINTDCTPQLYALALSVGTGGQPMYMAPGALPNSPSGSLLGRPVIESEFNATLGTVGDIGLFDMTQYVMIDRDVQSASSIHVQFLTDQVAFRFVYRCDGQPKIAAPLTPYKGTGTLSPFVALATRA
jgi:HK97 family phage major capsid protein